MEEKSKLQVGGSIEKALKGEYSINVSAVLKEAWQTSLHSRKAINLGLLFCLAISLVVVSIAGQYAGGIQALMTHEQYGPGVNLALTLVVSPFIVGVELMGVFHAVGIKTKASMVWSFLNKAAFVTLCALLTSTFTSLGFALLIIPGVYLAVALSLVLPLLVLKNLSPLKAIVISLQATRFQWINLFLVYFVLVLALIFTLLPVIATQGQPIGILGLAITIFLLSYLAPMFYNVKGVLYREIFGMELSVEKGEHSAHDGNFLA